MKTVPSATATFRRRRRRCRCSRNSQAVRRLRPAGQVSGDTITGSYDDADQFLGQLATAGIYFDDVTDHLEREGLAKFEKSWSELGATIATELDRQYHDRTEARH